MAGTSASAQDYEPNRRHIEAPCSVGEAMAINYDARDNTRSL